MRLRSAMERSTRRSTVMIVTWPWRQVQLHTGRICKYEVLYIHIKKSCICKDVQRLALPICYVKLKEVRDAGSTRACRHWHKEGSLVRSLAEALQKCCPARKCCEALKQGCELLTEHTLRYSRIFSKLRNASWFHQKILPQRCISLH